MSFNTAPPLPLYSSISSDFELLLSKIRELPAKDMATLLHFMLRKIEAEKNNLGIDHEDEDSGEGASASARCTSSDKAVVCYGQASKEKDEYLRPLIKRRAVHKCDFAGGGCEYTAPSAHIVKRHSAEVHQLPKQIATIRKKDEAERRNKCPICGKSHRSEIALHVHLKSHNGDNDAGEATLRYVTYFHPLFE